MRSLSNGTVVVAVAALSFSGAFAVGYLIWRSRRKQSNKPADEWYYVGQLGDITLYPIKSTAGIMLEESECVDIGLQYEGFNDRQFVLMQANGKLMFAGAYPQMLGIKATIVGKRIIRFTAPNMPALEVNIESEFLEPLGKKRKGIRELKKTGFTLRIVEGEDEQHKWFSRAIFKEETGVRLFLNLKPKVHNKWWNRGVSDFFPLMVLHSRSVNDLNKRLPQEDLVDPAQFRGNLLIDTSATPDIRPYEEDHWQWIMIGFNPEHSVILQFNSYCYRCILPNINVETLERNKNFEPLRTLKSYRLLDNPEEPVMGVYYNVYKQGSLQRGAEVYVQYRKRELEKS